MLLACSVWAVIKPYPDMLTRTKKTWNTKFKLEHFFPPLHKFNSDFTLWLLSTVFNLEQLFSPVVMSDANNFVSLPHWFYTLILFWDNKLLCISAMNPETFLYFCNECWDLHCAFRILCIVHIVHYVPIIRFMLLFGCKVGALKNIPSWSRFLNWAPFIVGLVFWGFYMFASSTSRNGFKEALAWFRFLKMAAQINWLPE
jgi:hypothetical protein